MRAASVSVRVRGDSKNVHGAAAGFDHEQAVQPLELGAELADPAAESPVGAPAPVRPELTAGIAAGAGVGMVNMLLGGRFAEIPFGAFAPRGRADQPQHTCSGPGRQVVAIPNEPSALGRGSARCDSGRQVSAVDLPAEGARRTEAVPGA
jgi:hypothetical protein